MGAIQGLTEFIPISSSAHLAILHKIFPWDTSAGLVFDVILHLGTLVALLAYFWREWADMVKVNLSLGEYKDHSTPKYAEAKAKSMPLLPILLASIPAALVGVVLEKKIEAKLDNAAVIGCTMIALGIVLYIADHTSKGTKPMEKATIKDIFIIGCAQALAIIPGVSRSGITITAGLFSGLRREAAARFSFLLGAPIIFGAALYELRKIVHLQLADILPFMFGLISSAVVGYIAIGYLIEYLKRRDTKIFVLYRLAFGILTLTAYAMGYLR